MRITGYILLLFGFLWLLWAAFASGALARSLSQFYPEQYPITNSYSGEQLHHAVVEVVHKYHDFIPRIALPATLMFVGGILLDQAARRDAKRKPPIIQGDRPAAS